MDIIRAAPFFRDKVGGIDFGIIHLFAIDSIQRIEFEITDPAKPSFFTLWPCKYGNVPIWQLTQTDILHVGWAYSEQAQRWYIEAIEIPEGNYSLNAMAVKIACVMIFVVPILIIYIFQQRNFTESIERMRRSRPGTAQVQ